MGRVAMLDLPCAMIVLSVIPVVSCGPRTAGAVTSEPGVDSAHSQSARPIARYSEAEAREDGRPCGRPPLPRCPLQQWMDARLAQPLASDKLDRVVDPLETLATAEPAGYAHWREIALRGAAAARRGELAEVRRACGDCHATHRARYRADGNRRALPLPLANPE